MLILGIDSSTETAAIGLIDDETLLGEVNLSLYRKHSERLMPNIVHLFNELDYSIKDIDGIAVTLGPGSFTGLRIALSTVKGFVQALSIPVIGLSTMEVIAYNCCEVKAKLVPMIDARRKRVYTALFDSTKNTEDFSKKRVWDDRTLSIAELIKNLEELSEQEENRDDNEFYFIGNTVNKYKDLLKSEKIKINTVSPFLNKPSGGIVAYLGNKYLKEGYEDNIIELTPNYLKKPQAEINYKKFGSD